MPHTKKTKITLKTPLLAVSALATVVGSLLLTCGIHHRDHGASQAQQPAISAVVTSIAAPTQTSAPSAQPASQAAPEVVQAAVTTEPTPAAAAPATSKALSNKLNSLTATQQALNGQGIKSPSALPRDIVRPSYHDRYVRLIVLGSLSVTAQNAGLPQSLVAQLSRVFQGRFDVAKNIFPGDQVEILFQEKIVDNTRIGIGHILAARLTHMGKSYVVIRYHNKQGKAAYYANNGDSLKRNQRLLSFLASPAPSARITSRFSVARRHPILGRVRPHKGVDFAAPRGTPIKATADGKIFFVGRKGGYGNTIIIQHSGRYRTLYGHMRGFAQGIRPGRPVKQGQVIGYIGSTGLSSGPHVHYEFQINGVPVNPLTQKRLVSINTPSPDALTSAERAKFRRFSQALLARMDQQKATALAMNSIYELR